MKFRNRPLLAGLMLVSLSCSLVVGKLAVQNCASTADCDAKAQANASFAGTICDDVAHVCVTPPTPDADTGCKSNLACSASFGGVPALCVPTGNGTSKCAKIETDPAVDNGVDCKLEPDFDQTVWGRDEAIIMGMVDRKSEVNSTKFFIQAAVDALLEVSSLPEAVDKGFRRPLMLVTCDYKKASIAATVQHLQDLGISGVIGPQQTIAFLSTFNETFPRRMFLMGTTVSSPTVTTLDDLGLVWRVAPSAAHEAHVANLYLADVEKEVRAKLSLTSGQPIKVNALYLSDQSGDKDPSGVALRAAFVDGLKFNGKDLGGTGAFTEFAYDDPANGADETSLVDKIINPPGGIGDLAHVIVVLDEGQANLGGIIDKIEGKWPAGAAYKPIWIFLAGSARLVPAQNLAFLAVKTPDFAPRARIPFTRERSSLYADFLSKFSAKHVLTAADPSGIGQTYDAAYSLAYAYYGGGPRKVRLTGTEMASGMSKLIKAGVTPVVNVGPGVSNQNITTAFGLLQVGKNIDLNGVTNGLDFDETGEPPRSTVEIDVRCLNYCTATSDPPCATTADGGLAQKYITKPSGRAYDNVNDKLTGPLTTDFGLVCP